MLLLGWRSRSSCLPWESMEIYRVRDLFTLNEPRIPLCLFRRDICISGDPSARLAMTWSGSYVLMAETAGVSVLDPSNGGRLIAVIRANDLVRRVSRPAASAQILNICCDGRVALVWFPTSRALRVGTLVLAELNTCSVLLTLAERIALTEGLADSVQVSDDCRSVMFKAPDDAVRVYGYQAKYCRNVTLT